MKNIFYIVSAGILTGLFAFGGMVSIVRAETRYHGATIISADTFWDKSGSPYVPEDDVIIQAGATLTIGPGVEVHGPQTGYKPSFSIAGGTLRVEGTEKERVSLHDLNGFFSINSGGIAVEYADMDRLNMGVLFENSHGIIASSSITRSLYGIEVRTSGVSVRDSRIASNTDGIIVQRAPGPFLMKANDIQTDSGTGGIGNALDDLPDGRNLVIVSGSIIEGNSNFGLNNKDWSPVHVANNWWGSPAGPGSDASANPTFGKVEVEPWLTSRPRFGISEPGCCSSVLFIPGLEASRLYAFEQGTGINQLWEPNRNADVKKLLLDGTGASVNPGVYAGTPIGKALGISNIYASFMEHLDGLRDSGAIGEWKSYGYDWRKSIAEVVAGRERRATTTDSLTETLEGLAARSRTGKVSIIAHSNGGLVAKYLVKMLVDSGREGLIDSVISVAVPYLGTPQAILGLLHGDGQSIGGGIIVNQSVMRELGVNMSSAYSLLPSRGYFSKVFGPSIAFAATTTIGVNDGKYPKMIDSFDQQKAFILDTANGRSASISSKISIPIEGNALLASAAESLHSILDPFIWPSTIARWAIVGWGNRTAKGIVYSEKSECRGPGANARRAACEKVPTHAATTTSMGDGTVVVPSAAHQAGTVVSIDLAAQKGIDRKTIDHVNILEASTTKSAIGTILTSGSVAGNLQPIAQLSSLPGVTMGEPDASQEKVFLVVSTHSPVDLHLYDKDGNHTGLAPLPTGTTSFGGSDQGLDGGLYSFYESEIPGSSFEMHEGYDGNETYITLDDDHAEAYSVVIDGTDVGTFDYKVERIRGGQILDSAEYVGLPVTPLTAATGTVATKGLAGPVSGQGSSAFASSTALRIDIDGDGDVDMAAKPGTDADPIACLDAIRKTILTLIGDGKRSKDIIKRVDRLEALARKGKLAKVRDRAEKLKNKLAHKKPKLLTTHDKDQIVGMVDDFITQFE